MSIKTSGLSALISGSVASVATTLALGLLARSEGKRAVQPTNATSHWLHGKRAGQNTRADLSHTAAGYATHHASAVFWALPFEMWLATQPRRGAIGMLRDASVMSAIAAAVDYGLVPKRLTPGWENVLSKKAIVATYAAMAVGLAAGALLTQELRRNRYLH